MALCTSSTLRSLTSLRSIGAALGSSHSVHSIAQAISDRALNTPDNELASFKDGNLAKFHEVSADPPFASSELDLCMVTSLRHAGATTHSDKPLFMPYMRRQTLRAPRVVSLGHAMPSVLRPRSPSLHLSRRPKLTLDTDAACERRLRSLALHSERSGSDATPALSTSSSLSTSLSLPSGISLAKLSPDAVLSSVVSSGSFVLRSPRINGHSPSNNSPSAPVRPASILEHLPDPFEEFRAPAVLSTQDPLIGDTQPNLPGPLATSAPTISRRAHHVPAMHLETTLAAHIFSVRLPIEVQPQMVTVFQKHGGRIRVVVDLWHLQQDAHFEWELIMSVNDVDMTSVRAVFEPGGYLAIHVKRRPLHATNMPLPVILVI